MIVRLVLLCWGNGNHKEILIFYLIPFGQGSLFNELPKKLIKISIKLYSKTWILQPSLIKYYNTNKMVLMFRLLHYQVEFYLKFKKNSPKMTSGYKLRFYCIKDGQHLAHALRTIIIMFWYHQKSCECFHYYSLVRFDLKWMFSIRRTFPVYLISINFRENKMTVVLYVYQTMLNRIYWTWSTCKHTCRLNL